MRRIYKFIVVMDRQLSQDELNELECALAAQVEDMNPVCSQLVETTPSEQDDAVKES